MKNFKLKIEAPVTDLMALRVMRKGGRYAEFICGVDAVDNNKFVIANAPEVYSSHFYGLVENVLSAFEHERYRNYSDAEYFLLCDDSESFCYDQVWTDEDAIFPDEIYNEEKHRSHLLDLDSLRRLTILYDDAEQLLKEQEEYLNGKPM